MKTSFYSSEEIVRCSRCTFRLTPESTKCKNCGLWNIHNENKSNEIYKSNQIIKTLDNYQDQEITRIKTGGKWDETFGGGLVPGSVMLIKGDPGAGKSTLLAQIIKAVSKKVLYISSEESGSDVKGRFTRLGLPKKTLEQVYFISTLQESIDIEESVKTIDPFMLIIDSLQGLSRIVEEQLEMCEQLKALVAPRKTVCMAISQVTKDQDFAGLMATQHAVDATFEIVLLDDDVRAFAGVKNRFGATPAETYYKMSERGLVSYEYPTDE
jgi:DNA repair protein RadA/Sms